VLTASQLAMLDSVGARLRAYALALTHDRDAAADLVQDGLVRVIASAHAPFDERAFRAWACRIVRNLWIDRYRTTSRRQEVSVDAADLPADDKAWRSEDVVLNGIAVRQAFFALGHDHRDVLAMVDIMGFSYAEAADLLDVKIGTIMSRVSRARHLMVTALSDGQVVTLTPARRRGHNA
jgi:RNA polymerase sigma-70 factor, ECF subfamily